MNTRVNYPPMPVNADADIIKPSATFKKSVLNVTLAMLSFIIVYILMIIGAVGIAIAFGAIGIGIISVYPSFLTGVLGLGLVLGGIMLLYFLVKFMFKSSKIDRSGMLEVKEKDQPELFAFIRQITNETHAPFPKHIFLTANVNASVFYNSTFWSMFFPVKKNLQIGLGLINCLNLSEFKAVMAHEFGHFSQRSMKFGSYTYNTNRIIYNMLYDNDGYQQAINTMGSLHYFIRLGIVINIQLIKGIQHILQKMYLIVNRSYLNLSRQMEFHADAVSAYVSGSNHTISSLRRIELSQLCYNSMFNYLNTLANDKKRPANIYPYHMGVMSLFAEDHRLPADAWGMPIINKKLDVLDNSQIVIADQWSSHPSTDDRERHLNEINLVTATSTDSAWVLFNEPEKLQAQLSDMIYESVTEKYEIIDAETAKQLFNEQANAYSYNKIYKGYYKARYINEFDVDEAIAQPYFNQNASLDEVLTDELANLPARMQGIENDIATVNAIAESDHVKSFDFKGIKYTRIDAPNIAEHLKDELDEADVQLKNGDKEIFIFCYWRKADKDGLAKAYRDFFIRQQQAKDDLARYQKLVNTISPIYSKMPMAEIETTVACVHDLEEEFKPHVRAILDNTDFVITDEQRAAMEEYISKKWIYFNGSYVQSNIDKFNNGVNAYYAVITDFYFACKKHVLDLQLAE